MKKKLFFSISDNCELSYYYLADLDAVMEYIENSIPCMDEEFIQDHEWVLRPVFMTQDEFDNLPEYQF